MLKALCGTWLDLDGSSASFMPQNHVCKPKLLWEEHMAGLNNKASSSL